ncbi:hypothetical protein TSUD_74680 [Trifolium subterraneum]|nr:hypothetical protein TSUD_74680 [Trifolium subterraneum]
MSWFKLANNRQVSAASNIWQPKVVWWKQKQMVGQWIAEAWIPMLTIELGLFNQQIMRLEMSYVSREECNKIANTFPDLSLLPVQICAYALMPGYYVIALMYYL